jgi:hypothetical protein
LRSSRAVTLSAIWKTSTDSATLIQGKQKAARMKGISESARPSFGFVRSRKTVAFLALPFLVAIAAFFPRRHWKLSSLAYAAPTHPAKGKQARKDFEYTVSDCQGPEKNDSVALELSDGSVKLNQILTMNCIAATRPNTVKVVYAKKGHNLEVTVILRSEVQSDCTCPIGIEGTISNLAKGDYHISFVFDYKLGRSLDDKATKMVLGTKEFSVAQ